jgi:TetR/AcrR family transcriptional regulator, cholesterol catabolism regulator
MDEGAEGYASRRANIVEVAAEIFREKGYDESTLSDIAGRLGMDRASIYYYVGSKEELLQEIIRDVLAHDLATVTRIQESDVDPAQKVRELVASMVASFTSNYPNMNVYIEGLRSISRQDSEWATDVMDRTRRYEKIVLGLIVEAQEAGVVRGDLSANLIALALFGMVNWLHRWYRPNSRYSPEEIERTFATILTSGAFAPE